MKRFFGFMLASLVVLLSFAGVAQAQQLIADSAAGSAVEQVQEDVIGQLKAKVLPQIQNILTPEQQEQLETAIVKGTSMRKAFKSLTLSPKQKTQLAAVFKSLPKKEIFATMTPEQKRDFFMNKAFFKPPEEVTESEAEKGQ